MFFALSCGTTILPFLSLTNPPLALAMGAPSAVPTAKIEVL